MQQGVPNLRIGKSRGKSAYSVSVWARERPMHVFAQALSCAQVRRTNLAVR